MSKDSGDVRIENPTMPAGFVREGRHVLYTHPQRLALEAGEPGGEEEYDALLESSILEHSWSS